MINLFFFQNCLSPHQLPYIKELKKTDDIENIWIIVPQLNESFRTQMGWDTCSYCKLQNLNIIIDPDKSQIIDLLEQYQGINTWCLFSGISSFPMVNLYFKISLKYNLHRGIITEPPFIYKHPLWLHAIRFAINDWKYIHYIDKIFLMGDNYLSYYQFWSKKWDVVPFMYCTEWKNRESPITTNDKLRILYVGSLIRRKNVKLLLRAIQSLSKEEQEKLEIGIIGNGKELENLKFITHSPTYCAQTQFYGVLPMEKVSQVMEQYDILCLPSLYDGWGAVINEALTLGLYALCTDRCGAKYLIEKSQFLCGKIFHSNNINDLQKALLDCLNNKEQIKNKIKERINWARNHIHGEIVAQYFINHLKL